MPGPPSQIQFDYTYRISPIILVGGIAGGFVGGAVPIVTYLQPDMFRTLLDTGTGDLTYDNFFAHFDPLPQASLIENQIGEYPFANQTVAANAIIVQPLRVSLRMIATVKPPNKIVTLLRSSAVNARSTGRWKWVGRSRPAILRNRVRSASRRCWISRSFSIWTYFVAISFSSRVSCDAILKSSCVPMGSARPPCPSTRNFMALNNAQKLATLCADILTCTNVSPVGVPTCPARVLLPFNPRSCARRPGICSWHWTTAI